MLSLNLALIIHRFSRKLLLAIFRTEESQRFSSTVHQFAD